MMKKKRFSVFRSFPLTLTTIILMGAGLPALLLSFPLIKKIYQITRRAALNELELRAENIAMDLRQQLNLTASRLIPLGETSDVILGSYVLYFEGKAAQYLLGFEEDNPLVASVYLVNARLSVLEVAPASIGGVKLPLRIEQALEHLFRQEAAAVQSQYQFIAFKDGSFFEQSFRLIADERKQERRRCSTEHGIAMLVPLVNDEGVGGAKKIKGALVAVVPVEYLLSYIRAKVHPPAVFDIQEEDGESLLKREANSDSSRKNFQENLIAGNTLLRIRDSGSSNRELHYRILLSEPSSIRFAEVKTTLYSLLISVFISVTLILVFAYIIARLVLAPLKKMQGIVSQYASGDYSPFQEKIFFAEFADFACLLERMGEKILDQLASLQEINSAYARFVPNDFLNYLKKESITEVQLGDHVEKNMSVLFADIADFTTISEQMSPKENFTFVNSILNAVGPVIRDHNGFIDKYIGDAIMALFDMSPADAIDAAIGMLDAVTCYNEQQREQEAWAAPIKIRIGINTGHLMLGIIGEYGRMDGTVISDAVNLASRLEGLAKMYGASLLISGHTYYCLKSMKQPLQYTIRELDLVAVKGKSEPVSVFEVMEGEESEVMQKKRATKKQFEKGVLLYREKRFHRTLHIMREILEYNPADAAAKLYLDRCKNNIQVGVPKNWRAITRLCVK